MISLSARLDVASFLLFAPANLAAQEQTSSEEATNEKVGGGARPCDGRHIMECFRDPMQENVRNLHKEHPAPNEQHVRIQALARGFFLERLAGKPCSYSGRKNKHGGSDDHAQADSHHDFDEAQYILPPSEKFGSGSS
jgi:hypothetical protein